MPIGIGIDGMYPRVCSAPCLSRLLSLRLLALDISSKPEARRAPITTNSAWRESDQLGDFLLRQATKKTKLDNRGLTRIQPRQLIKRVVQGSKRRCFDREMPTSHLTGPATGRRRRRSTPRRAFHPACPTRAPVHDRQAPVASLEPRMRENARDSASRQAPSREDECTPRSPGQSVAMCGPDARGACSALRAAPARHGAALPALIERRRRHGASRRAVA